MTIFSDHDSLIESNEIIFQLEKKLLKYKKIADAASKLVGCPYNRPSKYKSIKIPESNNHDIDVERWDNLKDALHDCGYEWEEYT